MSDLDEQYPTAAEACRVLGIVRRTLNRYVKQGRIAKVEHRGRTYISRRAIADYWARKEHDGDHKRAAAEKQARLAQTG